jgi:RluA family pseudouridine synthase
MTLSRKIRLVSSYPYTHQTAVRSDGHGKELHHYLVERFPHVGEKVWRHREYEGLIHVLRNGKPVEALKLNEAGLLAGDTIVHHVPKMIEPSVPDEVMILEESSDIVAVFKPAPMPMHAGGRYYKNSLHYILQEKGYEGLRIVHRLDAVTSGLVVLAKNKEMARECTKAFERSRVKKIYWARVQGSPNEKGECLINAPIRRKKGFVFECGDGLDGALAAQTSCTLLHKDGPESLIQCRPITGRTHQIRLHLSYWGHPIYNDPIYGPNGDNSGVRLQNQGIALVSKSLEFPTLGLSFSLPDQLVLDTLRQ